MLSRTRNKKISPKIRNVSFMLESRLKNRTQISRDNPIDFNQILRTTRLSQILDLESTSRERDLLKSWSSSFKEKSKRLWLPMEIDSLESDLSSFNGCSNNLTQHLKLCSKKQSQTQQRNSRRISWKLSQSILPDITKRGDIKTLKIRIYPNQNQKILFKRCLEASKIYYNKAVNEINNRFETKKKFFQDSKTCIHCSNPKELDSFTCQSHSSKKIKWDLNISFIDIRNTVVEKHAELISSGLNWIDQVPCHTRQLIVRDAITAYKACCTSLKNGNINSFKLGEKLSSDMFCISQKALKVKDGNIELFVTRLKTDKFLRTSKANQRKLSKIDYSSRESKIIFKGGKWYLLLLVEQESSPILSKKEIISLDPGIRTFQTCYDPSGNILEFGKNDSDKIKEIYSKIDHLTSIKSNSNSKTRKSISKRILKLYDSIKGIVKNLHNQTASFLTKNYDKILLPSFDTSQMLRSKKLHRSVKRLMGSLSFFEFKEKMKQLCSSRGVSLFIVGEEYTSKLCGSCGSLNDVGSSKIYSCGCGLRIDRDINGARNILLKHLD